ncbi:MAG: hypothetical protein SNJ57_09340 [Cyanobacteriota bacterium]
MNTDLSTWLPVSLEPQTQSLGLGDWVCLDRQHFEVAIAIESEWSLPLEQRCLSNFSIGQILDCCKDTGDSFCLVQTLNHEEMWLPTDWLLPASHQGIDSLLVNTIANTSPLLPIASRITVAGHPFDLKIYPPANPNDHAFP